MELRVLRYFLAVAREESISGAAQALHITQPTLSRQLMNLEEELGRQLLIRGKRRISLTEEGQFLRQRAEEMIDLADKTEAAIVSSGELVNGDISIGGGETDAMRLIARIAGQLQCEHPDIRYHLYSGNADDVTERLDKGLLDFGILIEPAPIDKYHFIRLPVTDVWGVLMRRDSPLAAQDAIRPEDLWDVPLITSRQGLFSGNGLSGWLNRDVNSLHITATYNLIYNASLMVAEGMGYAFCLDKLVNTAGGSPLCFRPLSPRFEAHLDIVWKKHQVFSKAASLFMGKLRDAFEPVQP